MKRKDLKPAEELVLNLYNICENNIHTRNSKRV